MKLDPGLRRPTQRTAAGAELSAAILQANDSTGEFFGAALASTFDMDLFQVTYRYSFINNGRVNAGV